MRLKSEIFVSALLRRVFALGGYAAVERKGAGESGSVFIRQRFRDGLETLYAPAPQSFLDAAEAGDRLFEIRLDRVAADAADGVLAGEVRFDSDCWIVEIEIDDRGDLFQVRAQDGGRKG